MRLGGLDEVAFVLGDSGQRLVLVDGVEREVVVATARDLVESGFGSSLSEGVFLLGTGSNGVCESMLATGGLVFVLMQTAFWGYRLPATRVPFARTWPVGVVPSAVARPRPRADALSLRAFSARTPSGPRAREQPPSQTSTTSSLASAQFPFAHIRVQTTTATAYGGATPLCRHG